jgi:hypothetical protein
MNSFTTLKHFSCPTTLEVTRDGNGVGRAPCPQPRPTALRLHTENHHTIKTADFIATTKMTSYKNENKKFKNLKILTVQERSALISQTCNTNIKKNLNTLTKIPEALI